MKFKFKSIYFYRAILFITVLLSLYVTWYVTGNILDSDASSELILSRHLFDTRQLFSTDWIYSTELRVVHTHLIYAPLFLIFGDWHKVRFVGAVFCQFILIMSYGYMIKPLKMDRKVFYLGSSLTLLPISVAYGRVILYHCHYIPHIIISFILMGLIFRIVDERLHSKSFILNCITLAIISFINGTIGVRGLLIFHIPLLFATVILLLTTDYKKYESAAIKQPEHLKAVISSAVSAVFSVAGFIFNSTYFRSKYQFGDYTSYDLGIIDTDGKLTNLIYGLLHQFGFRDNVDMISIMGIASVLGSLLGVFLICVAVSKFFSTEKDCNDKNYDKHLLQSMFISILTVLISVFILSSKDNSYYYPLYFIPITSWLIPFLMCLLEDIPDKCHIFNSKRIFTYAMVVVFAVNGFINMGFYTGVEKFDQTYEGLSFKNKNIIADISGPIHYVRTNGYTHGYATFWFSNIITEFTDGQIPMSNIYIDKSNKFIYYDWLTLKSNRGYHEKSFLLLDLEQRHVLEDDPELQGKFELVYDNKHYFVYAFNDEHIFHDVLTSRQ